VVRLLHEALTVTVSLSLMCPFPAFTAGPVTPEEWYADGQAAVQNAKKLKQQPEITQPGQTPGASKDVAGWSVKITAAGTRRLSAPAQRPSVELTPERISPSANAPPALVGFGTNNCPSQTLASANGRVLRSGGGGE